MFNKLYHSMRCKHCWTKKHCMIHWTNHLFDIVRFYVISIATLSLVFFFNSAAVDEQFGPTMNSIMDSFIMLLFIIRLACVIFVVFVRLKVNATRDHTEKKSKKKHTSAHRDRRNWWFANSLFWFVIVECTEWVGKLHSSLNDSSGIKGATIYVWNHSLAFQALKKTIKKHQQTKNGEYFEIQFQLKFKITSWSLWIFAKNCSVPKYLDYII